MQIKPDAKQPIKLLYLVATESCLSVLRCCYAHRLYSFFICISKRCIWHLSALYI